MWRFIKSMAKHVREKESWSTGLKNKTEEEKVRDLEKPKQGEKNMDHHLHCIFIIVVVVCWCDLKQTSHQENLGLNGLTPKESVFVNIRLKKANIIIYAD